MRRRDAQLAVKPVGASGGRGRSVRRNSAPLATLGNLSPVRAGRQSRWPSDREAQQGSHTVFRWQVGHHASGAAGEESGGQGDVHEPGGEGLTT